MKEHKLQELIDKYKAGQTSLSEEQALLQQFESLPPEMKAWAKFVEKKKIEAPEGLNDRLWDSFEKKKTKTKSKTKTSGNLLAVISIAASVTLMVSVFALWNHSKQESSMSYAEKQAQLNQAMDMFSQPTEDILYENEMIVIYTQDSNP